MDPSPYKRSGIELLRAFATISKFGQKLTRGKRRRSLEYSAFPGRARERGYEDDSTIGTAEAANDAQRDDAESADEPQRVESQEESDYACPVCKKGRMIRGCEFPRPTVAELLAIPWRELDGARLVQEQFF